MLILPIDDARPGMKLVMGVFHPEHPDQEMLKPGFVMEAAVLQRLRAMGVPHLCVDYPDLGDLDRHLLGHLSPARQRIYCHVRDTIAAVQEHARPVVTFTDYYAATRELVLTLLGQGEHPIYMDLLATASADAVGHATAVAHLSLTIGLRLESYIVQQRSRLPVKHAREVVNLGVAGMLHDIGKTKLPAALRGHCGAEPPADEALRRQWETHASIGADMLRNGVEASASASVAQHHEHYDGSGFPPMAVRGSAPRPLAADQIHIFARIIAAADLYEGLSTVDGRRRAPAQIMHLMSERYAPRLDPYILQALPKVIPPFPPGSRLELSDGTPAVVRRINPERPYCPTVQRIGDNLALVGEPFEAGPDAPVTIRRMAGLDMEPIIRAARMAA